MVFFRSEREPDSVHDADGDAAVDESPRSRAGSGSGVPLEPSPCVNATRATSSFLNRLERVQRGDETGGVREMVAAPPPPISPTAADCAAAVVPMPPPIDERVSQTVEEDDDEELVDPELGAPLLVGGLPAPPTRSFLRGGLSMDLGGVRTSSLTSFR